MRVDFKNISFPAVLGNNAYPDLGIHELVEAERPAFDPDIQELVLGVEPAVNRKYLEVWSVVAKEFDEAALRARHINSVKRTANSIILARLDEVKQRNCLAFSGEYTQNLVLGLTPSPEGQQTMEFIKGEWTWVKSVRAASNQIEAHLASLPVAEANTYDIAGSDLWPQ